MGIDPVLTRKGIIKTVLYIGIAASVLYGASKIDLRSCRTDEKPDATYHKPNVLKNKPIPAKRKPRVIPPPKFVQNKPSPNKKPIHPYQNMDPVDAIDDILDHYESYTSVWTYRFNDRVKLYKNKNNKKRRLIYYDDGFYNLSSDNEFYVEYQFEKIKDTNKYLTWENVLCCRPTTVLNFFHKEDGEWRRIDKPPENLVSEVEDAERYAYREYLRD